MLPLPSLSSLETVWGLFKKFWYVLPLATLAIYAFALKLDNGNLESTVTRSRITEGQLRESNRQVQASLDAAVIKIEDNNARIVEAAKRLEAQRVQAAADLAAANARYSSTIALVRTLEAQAARVPVDACVPSELALTALEKL